MSALRIWRRASGRSIEQLAAELQVSKASLSRIERGEQWPSAYLVGRIIAVTNGSIQPNDLLAAPAELRAS